MRTVLLAGSSHRELARDLANELGLRLGDCEVERFPDGEVEVLLREEVRHAEVFILQGLHAPVGEHILELALLADACRRAGACAVTAVVPYLGYARQDRRETGLEPLGARVVADLLAGGRNVDRLVCMDLHSRAVEGCFAHPVEHASVLPALLEALRPSTAEGAVVVSPDMGAIKRAELLARPLQLPVAVVHKHRLSGSSVQAHAVVGDVRGRRAIVCDDMISTGGTIEAAVKALLAAGALPQMTVVAAHGLFCGPAVERLAALPLERIVVSDSVPVAVQAPFALERVRCAPRLASVVRRLMTSTARAGTPPPPPLSAPGFLGR